MMWSGYTYTNKHSKHTDFAYNSTRLHFYMTENKVKC